MVLYLYNKAPRSARAHRRYEELRRRLDALRGERRLLVGRVPSDAILPRAFHEMLLVGEAELVDRVEQPLRELTLTLSRHIGDAGAFASG